MYKFFQHQVSEKVISFCRQNDVILRCLINQAYLFSGSHDVGFPNTKKWSSNYVNTTTSKWRLKSKQQVMSRRTYVAHTYVEGDP